MDLGCLGLAAADFLAFFAPTFFALASALFTDLVFLILVLASSVFFTALLPLETFPAVLFSFFPASDSLKDALILINFPLAAEFFS
ncbi:hypothetical protein OIU79_017908 [Salix purpurea]|uniref:Uncharacterized protein n=1 Tax=Salix purpurea TaxID=77065 RepID=A0A9Q0WZL5_SALPP|nr:hypothetical protein OIU79_017908 [Salix purpurea]